MAQAGAGAHEHGGDKVGHEGVSKSNARECGSQWEILPVSEARDDADMKRKIAVVFKTPVDIPSAVPGARAGKSAHANRDGGVEKKVDEVQRFGCVIAPLTRNGRSTSALMRDRYETRISNSRERQ